MKKIYHLISFLLFYLKEVWISNLVLALDIITPRYRMEPSIVKVPLKVKGENQILALSNLISMTPGSLALDYDDDGCCIRVHVMYYQNPEKFHRTMEEMQDRILKIS